MSFASDGTLSGITCGANGNYTVSITVTDSTLATGTGSVQLIVNKAPAGGCTLTFTTSTLPQGTVGTSYNQTITASGGTSPYTYTVSAGSLPTGLSLGTGGTLSGTPTTAGTYSFSITATDSSGATGVQSYSVTIAASGAALSLSSSASSSTQVGVSYSQTNTASGGTSPYSYAVSAGSLPAGVSLNASTGLASGTPTTAGSFSYTIRVTDSASATATQTISGTIAAATLVLNSTASSSTQVGVSYSQPNTASGGTSPYTYAVSAGSLPAGVTLNASTGLASGTPTTAGVFGYTIHVTDAASVTATQTVSGTIAAAALVLTSTTSSSTQVGVAYSQTNSASGGTAPYAYAVSAGSLPAGVTLNSSIGLVSGTPTTAGAFSYTIRVTDAASVTATQTVAGTIAAATLALTSTASSSTQAGVPYSQTNAASGGISPYTYAVSSGTLPAGVSLNASTGLVSGTPTTAGSFSYTIRVTDSVSTTATQTISGAIAAATLVLNSAASSSAQVGVSYSQTNSASGGTTPYTYAVSAGSLPAGVTLNASTGLVSGTPTTAGAFSYTIRVTDAASVTATQAISGTIAPVTLALTSTASSSTQVGASYSQSNAASGGTSPYTYAVSAGSLPAGVTLNSSTGLVSGTPTTAGSFSYSIRVTDSASATATQALSGTIATATLVLNSTASSNTQIGVAYSQANSASGGTAPYTFALSAGSLPAGVSINASTGLVSGTPTAAGAFSYTIRVTDAASAAATQTIAGTVAPATLTLSATVSAGTQVGISYSQANAANGGTAPYAYAVAAGSLPAGVILNTTTGLVSGTPTSAGAFSYTIRVTDAASATATQTISGTIAAATLVLTSTASISTQVGVAYAQANSAGGGTAPYAYAVAAGSLPTGVTLNSSTGLVSGTATTAGSFSYTIRVTDSVSATATQTISGTIASATLALSTTASSSAQVGVIYSQTNAATGGTSPYTYAVAAGSLPTGVTLNSSTGLVAGTPTTAGSFSYTIRVTDAASGTATQTVSGTIAPAMLVLSSTAPSNTQIGVAYSQANSASGGTAPYTYTVSAGSLPAGLALNASTGLVSGTPTTAGSFSYAIRVTDGASVTTTQTISGTIAPAALTLSVTASTSAQVGVAYSQASVAAGGTLPYTYTISAGALPAGVSLNASAGLVSGTPTTAGSFSYTIRVTDSVNATAAQTISGTIAAATLVLNFTASSSTQVGIAYSQSNSANGGTAPYTFAVSAGALPVGVALNASNGLVTGTPSVASAFNYTIRVTDAASVSATQTVSGTIAAATLTLSVSAPSTTRIGSTFNSSDLVSGGLAPYAFAITGGSLPAGLALNPSTGVISGTPTTAGPYSFTIRVTDASGATITQTITGTIQPAALTITTGSLTNITRGVPTHQTLTATGGVAPYTFVVTAGSLPPGLTLAHDGTLSGAATQSGSFIFTVQVTDSATPQNTTTQAYTITVIARPDPTKDPNVIGLLNQEASAAQRFTLAQITNYQTRLQTLHTGGPQCAQGSNRANAHNDKPTTVAALEPPANDTSLNLPVDNCRASPDGKAALWSTGAVEFGSYRGQAGGDGFQFDSQGITLGGDFALRPDFVVGAGIGFAHDHSDITSSGTADTANGVNMAGYISYQPMRQLYLDAVLGVGDLSFSTTRALPSGSGYANGRRHANQWFISLGSAYRAGSDRLAFMPYGRFDIGRVTLGGYNESGSDTEALSFADQSIPVFKLVVGTNVQSTVRTSLGMLMPRASLEYRHEYEHAGTAWMRYADETAGPYYQTQPNGIDRDTFALGLGASLRLNANWSLGFGYAFDHSNTAKWSRIDATLSKGF